MTCTDTFVTHGGRELADGEGLPHTPKFSTSAAVPVNAADTTALSQASIKTVEGTVDATGQGEDHRR